MVIHQYTLTSFPLIRVSNFNNFLTVIKYYICNFFVMYTLYCIMCPGCILFSYSSH